MAKKIIHFKDNDLNRQFDELLMNLTVENFRNNTLTLHSDGGKKFLLKVDNDGNLYTEEV